MSNRGSVMSNSNWHEFGKEACYNLPNLDVFTKKTDVDSAEGLKDIPYASAWRLNFLASKSTSSSFRVEMARNFNSATDRYSRLILKNNMAVNTSYMLYN